jgi:endonuclease YncB( thermonuclease family)
MAEGQPQTVTVRWLMAGLALLFSCGVALPDDMTGQASIIDGDTLEIHGTRVRLWGIDAPESSQLCRGKDSEQYRCGAQAANDLDAFIARRPVSCLPISLDRYGRTGSRRRSRAMVGTEWPCFGLA